MSTWRIWMSSLQYLISYDFLTNLTNLGLVAFIDQTGIQAFWCIPRKELASLNQHDYPVCTRSGDHKNGGVWGRRTHAKYRYPRKFRMWYFQSTRCLKLYPSHMKIVWSSTGSGGGDPYHAVWILCESGVRIKILESRSGITLSLVHFADPDHVRIRITSGSGNISILHFNGFLTGPYPKIRIWFAAPSGSFRKFLTTVFL